VVRRRRVGAVAVAVRSARDAFGQAAPPDTSSVAFASPPHGGQTGFVRDLPAAHSLPLSIAAPEIRHRVIPARGPRGAVAGGVVEMLQARSFAEALVVGRRLRRQVRVGDPQRPFLDRACAFALGDAPLPARWGADPVADWLRARRVDEEGQGESWLGILPWLGRHAHHWFRAQVVLDEMPLAATALASTQGLPRTLASVGTRLRERPRNWAGLLRVLILRCALEGTFSPESLRRGVVPTPRRGGDVVAADWKPLLLARRALIDAGHVVGAAHLTAALVATDVRRAIIGDLRLHRLRARVPAWGSRALDDKEADELLAMLHKRELRKADLPPRLPSAPWPAGWGGPDTHGVTRTLWALLGGDRPLARDIFLHDGLALAAVHALGGHPMNALSALGATQTPAALYEARAALAHAIGGGIVESTLPEDLPSKQADEVYRLLRELPEPNLALETPYRSLGNQRAEAQHAFQTSGRLALFRRLRLVLDRPHLAEMLDPFWLLPGRSMSLPLFYLVRITFARLEPPSADECRRFLRSFE
jgi:hypothetical protein